jgi:hypothetical protein
MYNLLFAEVSLPEQEGVVGGCLQQRNNRKNRNSINNRNNITNIFNINLNLVFLFVIGNGNIINISQLIKSRYRTGD